MPKHSWIQQAPEVIGPNTWGRRLCALCGFLQEKFMGRTPGYRWCPPSRYCHKEYFDAEEEEVHGAGEGPPETPAARRKRRTPRSRPRCPCSLNWSTSTPPRRNTGAWRYTKASVAEGVAELAGHAKRGLCWIRLHAIERFAANHLGKETTEKLIAYCRRTYPMPDYGYGFWEGVLSGKKFVMGYQHDPTWISGCGRPCMIETDVIEQTIMTRDEFWAMFPYKDELPYQPPDDGTAAALEGILCRRTRGAAT